MIDEEIMLVTLSLLSVGLAGWTTGYFWFKNEVNKLMGEFEKEYLELGESEFFATIGKNSKGQPQTNLINYFETEVTIRKKYPIYALLVGGKSEIMRNYLIRMQEYYFQKTGVHYTLQDLQKMTLGKFFWLADTVFPFFGWFLFAPVIFAKRAKELLD